MPRLLCWPCLRNPNHLSENANISGGMLQYGARRLTGTIEIVAATRGRYQSKLHGGQRSKVQELSLSIPDIGSASRSTTSKVMWESFSKSVFHLHLGKDPSTLMAHPVGSCTKRQSSSITKASNHAGSEVKVEYP